jgi:hypothetical protein
METLRTRDHLLFVAIILSGQIVYAGVKGKISGVITDKITGAVIPGVNIYLSGTNFGAATDLEDKFYIKRISF